MVSDNHEGSKLSSESYGSNVVCNCNGNESSLDDLTPDGEEDIYSSSVEDDDCNFSMSNTTTCQSNLLKEGSAEEDAKGCLQPYLSLIALEELSINLFPYIFCW